MNMLAYVRGKDAYSKGLGLADNPYKMCNMGDFLSWRNGWRYMEARD